MQPRTEILSYISDLCDASIGQLPESGGTSIELAPGSIPRTFLDGATIEMMSVLILSKNKNQMVALDNVEEICNQLTRITNHLKGINYTIMSLSVSTPANFVAKEESSGMWIYSAVIDVQFYNKEVFTNA